MRITAEVHLDPLLASLAANEQGPPVGESLEESSDYMALDAEMMKVGSLQHASVAWETAEALAIQMLSQRGKDLKVLGHLLHCLQHDGNGVRFALSLRLLSRALEQPWWEHAYPFNGPRGAKLRPRLFQQFTQRSVKLATGLDFHNAEDEFEACQSALTELQARAKQFSLPGDALSDLNRQLLAQRPVQPSSASGGSNAGGKDAGSQERGSNEQGSIPPGSHQANSSGATQPATAKAPELRLEAGNERSNRQALLKMADFLSEQSPGEPLAYRLRRYAVWSSIQALPGSKETGKTELAPVSADRIADYREALSRGGDHELWQRIENSLAVSPYWIEGHRLSAGLAKQLGHPRCAEAIRDEAQRFVERLPGIEKLTFNNGAGFVDDETQRWLYSSASGGGGTGGGGEAWQAGLEEARGAVESGDIGAALKVLDQGLSAARSPRESTYWRLASADLLHENGLESLAQQHYHTLHKTVKELALEQWEPSLVSRLSAAVKDTH
ncbi:type VI secretion system protein TssA [Halomonas sp. M1]|uniref:type VI secretion system protein TssA n=1 Tax=Halomonas sp. M1 TaxID=3035470 RepID=UPI002486AEE2|nr:MULTISPECIES: type VI secretion system protein TssA [unclassified Halomonas]MDP3536154.1 type VI secretion system protein TssA [Halomonas sp.]WFE70794.1 type VI secretion system protein TssA [Halomonas sp. M1]